MNNSKISLANEVILNMIRTANNLIKIGDLFFKSYNITSTQYNVLVILKTAKAKLSQQELSSQLVVSRADITGIIDRLEKCNYVKRLAHDHDRRIKLLQITQKGSDLVKKVENKYFKNIDKIVTNLSISELQELKKLILQLNNPFK